MDAKRKMLLHMRDIERFHELTFSRLSKMERDRETKLILERLSKVEGKHTAIWQKMIGASEPKNSTLTNFEVSLVVALRRLIGVALTVKIFERMEYNAEVHLDRIVEREGATKTEKALMEELEDKDEEEEDPLQRRIIMRGGVLKNIRDVIFGMNDGLVEVLAAVAGFGAALQTSSLVLIAGFIVAVSGTLSMSAGAYLSTNYEKTIHEDDGTKAGESASKSAYYVGLFYFIGAIFPVLPFAFGMSSYSGIAASAVVTIFVLVLVSTLMAIISDVSITKSVAKTLAISLCAIVVTVLLGAYTRNVLHINI
jgi:VIT1/CCC1 family predicted Fe2+/Mn2+ transporter